jgi:GDPmannose 4,6-dehydratase
MRAILFGASGQDGHYLSRLLESTGVEVVGVSRSGPFHRVNLAEFGEVEQLLLSHRPDYVFHLAAVSTTSPEVWRENHEAICTGSLHILEAARLHCPAARIFLAGSGLQFHNTGDPIKESDPFEARSPYALSRIHSVYAARYYRGIGLKCYVGYFFNHDSPLRSDRHIAKKIVESVRRMAAGSPEILEIGDPSVRKEWGYAADIVRGVWRFIHQEEHFEANIGTGEAHSIEEWIALCMDVAGISPHGRVRTLDSYVPEYRVLVSDPSRIHSMGWLPETGFQQLATLMMKS